MGYVLIPGVQNNPGHAGIFGGSVLANTYHATVAKQVVTPGAIFLSGQQTYVLHHTQKNVDQTGYEGFKLQFNQLACNSAGNYYASDGL
jgi:hypothetical protein